MITVRITQCPDPYAWYSGKIGEEFDVADTPSFHTYYLVLEEWVDGGYGVRRIPRAHCEEVKPFGRLLWAKILAALTVISVTFSAFGDTDQRTQPRNRLKPNRHNERMD